MPLIKSKTRKAFVSNLKAELAAGKPQKQALAIAYAVKRRARAEGGGIFDWSGVGEAMPENIGKEHIVDPVVTVPKSILWDLPHRAIDAAKGTTYGLRREDYTDVPPDYSPDPEKAMYGWGVRLPRGGWQPTDEMIGASLEAGTNVMGGTALSTPARAAGEFVAGAGPRDPALWHGISKVRLPKPISEMSAVHTPVPGAPERVISPSSLQGGRLLPLIGDRTRAGTMLEQVNGYRFGQPVEMQGGHGFMAQNADQGAAWASGAPVTGKLGRIVREQEGAPTYGVYTAMGERSGDFSHHVSDTLAEMMQHVKVPKMARKSFDDEMKAIAPGWPGVNSPKLRGYLLESPGELRSAFAKLMDTSKYQRVGFPSVAEARFATTDPRLLNQEWGASGASIAKLDPEGRVFKTPGQQHLSYETNLGGQYVGGLPESVPLEVMYPDITRSLQARIDASTGYKPRMDYLMSRPPKGTPLTQEANQQWVDTVSKHLENRGFKLGAGATDRRAAAAAAVDDILAQEKALAPPFFSHLEKTVEATPQEAMTGQQWLGLLNNRGVKAEEMQFTGVHDYLASKANAPVTKAELAQHLGENKIQLGEVNRADKRTSTTGETLFQARDRTAQDMFGRRFTDLSPDESDAVIDAVAAVQPTKYHSYQLPGGENYREKLLTLPQKPMTEAEVGRIYDDIYSQGHERWAEMSEGNRRTWREMIQSQNNTNAGYKSSHWDEPNVLAHRRTNEREVGTEGFAWRNRASGNTSQAFPTEAAAREYLQKNFPASYDGKLELVRAPHSQRSLHMEEIQSDWHQAGRKSGYVGQKNLKPEQLEEARRWETQGKMGLVPDAPFKKNWHEIAVKDAIREAAERGLNRISWTPGKAQADRYSLAKQIDELHVIKVDPEGTKFMVTAKPKGSRQMIDVGPDDIPADKLDDYVGKEMADRIRNQKEDIKSYEGIDLHVGGEGMRGFYDKILPDYLNKIGKPHGVKVQTGKTGLDRPGYDIIGEDGANYATFKGPPTQAQLREIAQQNLVPFDSLSVRKNAGMEGDVHYMDIPQSLKDEALHKGFRLGAGATDKRAAGLAAVDDVLAAERRLAGESRSAAIPEGPAAAGDATAVGPGGGGPAGARSLPEAQATAARWAGERKPLEGLPGPLKIGDQYFVPGPIGKIHDVAEDYMRSIHPDRPYTPPTKYHPLDPEHSKAIAQAYEEMKHTPNDPATKASYDALIDETAKQYEAIKKTGLKIEPIPHGAPDPYAANPRMAAIDVAENNHLWFFPTEGGFGTVNKITDNPMLRKTGEKIGDHELLANDMFRIVHDYFGHLKEGHGFRAAGEDNAWRTHAQMYSDIARPAMTTETRGQNSWVNYGPHGEKNRTASAADTVYADQKVGLLPEWVMRDRGSPAPLMVYHGTPHSFNRFDISKIGSGEGNQAYGHGLYFAGHEPVSEWYRHQLATRQDPLLKKYKLEDVGHVIGSHLSDAGGDAAKLAQEYAVLRDKLIAGGQDDRATINQIADYDRRIKYLTDPKRSMGHLYQVGMDVNPERLLDYDVPFTEQTQHVQGRTGPMLEQSVNRQIEALKAQLAKGTIGSRPILPGNRKAMEARLFSLEQLGHSAFPGNEIYKRAGLPAKNETEMAQQATSRLRGMDIPGLRYKDAGSRAPGQKGSYNYVMFSDDMLKILRKYGVVGIPAAGVLGADGEERRATGGAVNAALEVARQIKRAKGGKVHVGPIVGDTDGRADEVPMEVPDGAYVLTADHCSAMGEGNTLAGFKKLNDMFPLSAKARTAKREPIKRASGGKVPIYAADGEYVICPEDIINRWGDLDEGHRILDAWQTSERKKHVETLKGLAPPAQD